jgi:dephospho-CoA kinase
MGKSTIASMFKDMGVPVMDTDAEVHRLYAKDGAGVAVVSGIFPDAVIEGPSFFQIPLLQPRNTTSQHWRQYHS